MKQLREWDGRVENIVIEYDEITNGTDIILIMNQDHPENTPALTSDTTETIREVGEQSWSRNIKKADRVDYLIAVACGVFSGIIDSLFVGKFNLDTAEKWGTKKTNEFVERIAKLNGYKGKGLAGAIKYMEGKYPLASDSLKSEFGGGLQHHLRDFSHHFSIGGLLCSLFTQFSGKVIGTNTAGTLIILPLEDDSLIGKNVPEKILFGFVHWFFHLVSDMAGSSSSPGNGTGIPGPIGSFAKLLSAVPFFKDRLINGTEFHVWVSKLFNGTLLAHRDENGRITEARRFNLRTEIGALHEIGKQALPVIINECLVRGLYFFRRLYLTIKDLNIKSLSELKKVDASEFLPFNDNAVVRRMITISTGVFSLVDLADASIRSAIDGGGFVSFTARINVVGVGRFVIACRTEARFVKESKSKKAIEYEKTITEFDVLTLDYEQKRFLYSLLYLATLNDIHLTKGKEKKELKQKWLDEWAKAIPSDWGKHNSSLMEESISSYIGNHSNEPKVFLALMKSAIFKPYYPLFEEKTNRKSSNLKAEAGYLKNMHSFVQSIITYDDYRTMQMSFRQAIKTVSGSNKKLTIGLISYALSFFLPLVAASGILIAFNTAIMLDNTKNEGYLVGQCSLLLAYCKTVLIDKYHDYATVSHTLQSIEKIITALQAQIDEKLLGDRESSTIAKHSIGYLKNTKTALERKLKTETAFMHYLDVLDLKPDATIDDVNRAYKRKAKNFHPDTISSKELDEDLTQYAAKRFREIQEAYQYLKSRF